MHIVVATPGRLVDLASKGVAKLNQATMLVMDEAAGGLSNVARHVIDTPLNPRFFSYMAPYDVASNITQALGPLPATSLTRF